MQGRACALGDFSGRQAAEEAHLHHAGLPVVFTGQSVQRVVEGDHDLVTFGGEIDALIECKLDGGAALGGVTRARMVHENLAHHARRYGEKVGAILVARAAVIHQAQVGFMNQGGGLQRVALRFAAQVTFRDAVQLLVDQGDEEVERPVLAAIDFRKKRSYRFRFAFPLSRRPRRFEVRLTGGRLGSLASGVTFG